MNVDVEIVATSTCISSEEAFLVCLCDCLLELESLEPKLTSDVDVAGLCLHGRSDDQGSLHKLVGVMSEDLSVLACSWLRLVGVDDKIRGSTGDKQIRKTTYLPSLTLGMKLYLSPLGNPAPPLPLSPEALISSMIQSWPMDTISLVWCQSPLFIAPLINGSWSQ